jgi:hypothetical protein
MYKMKIVLFLIIIGIIYFAALQIKVVHVDTFTDQQKQELNDKLKIRSILFSNHFKCDKNDSCTNNFPETFSQFSDNSHDAGSSTADELIEIINLKCVDSQYKFNIVNQPVTTRYPNKDTEYINRKYIKYIKKNIKKWNKLKAIHKMIYIKKIIPLFVMETLNEFYMKVNIQLLYLNKTLHLQLTYYGQIEQLDDFSKKDIYTLQLVEIKPLTKNEYVNSINSFNEDDNSTPFMSMKTQLEYVNKINNMHKYENC